MFFTVRTNQAGLHDQLFQLDSLYCLGRALGYRYLHSPLSDSIHGFNGIRVDDFLGLRLRDARLEDREPNGLSMVDVDLAPFVPVVGPFPEIQEVRLAIQRHYGQGERLVYRFVFGYEVFAFLTEVRQRATRRFHFRYKYWKRREQWPVVDCYGDVAVRVAMHVRKGDATIFPLRGQYALKGRLVKDLASARHRHFELADYQRVLNVLQSRMGTRDLAVAVLSNGYAGAYRWLAPLRLSGLEMAAVDAERARFEADLRALQERPNVKVFLGEEEPMMFQSLHALARANVVVFNTGWFAPGMARRLSRTHEVRVFRPDEPEQIADYCQKALAGSRAAASDG